MVPRKAVNGSLEINDGTQNFKKIDQLSSSIVCNLVGLLNYSNDCFFNSCDSSSFFFTVIS